MKNDSERAGAPAVAVQRIVRPQVGLAIIFAIYSILYEVIIWGIFGWAVFVKGHSGWWVLVAITCSGAQLKPKHFGINTHE